MGVVLGPFTRQGHSAPSGPVVNMAGTLYDNFGRPIPTRRLVSQPA